MPKRRRADKAAHDESSAYQNGDVVWASCGTWWPAVFFDSWDAMLNDWDMPSIEKKKQTPIAAGECVVYFLGEEYTQYNVLNRSKVQPFDKSNIDAQSKTKQKFKSKQMAKKFVEALNEVKAYLKEISAHHDETGCEICGQGDDEENMLLCGDGEVGCDKGFHIHCLNPPLAAMPEGHWFCKECKDKAVENPQKIPPKAIRYTFTTVGHRRKKMSWKSPEYAKGFEEENEANDHAEGATASITRLPQPREYRGAPGRGADRPRCQGTRPPTVSLLPGQRPRVSSKYKGCGR
jgi:hypothetical protein